MTRPKNHHFNPQCYLKNFTLEGTNTGRLWVTDLDLKKQHPLKPETTGYQSGFHTIDDRRNPNIFETVIGSAESQSAPILQRVIETRELPPDEEASRIFFSFFALLAMRTPAARERFKKFMLTQELRQGRRASSPPDMPPELKELTDDELREVTDQALNPKFLAELKVPNLLYLRNLRNHMRAMCSALCPRIWRIMRFNDSIIVSDDPVLFMSANPKLKRASPLCLHSVAIIPLSRSQVMWGVFPPYRYWLDLPRWDRLGTWLNACVFAQANQYVYSCEKKYVLQTHRGIFKTAEDLFAEGAIYPKAS